MRSVSFFHVDSLLVLAEAERRKRAHILESEGKFSWLILQGLCSAIELCACYSSFRSNSWLKATGGVEATSLRVAEQYIQAFGNIAKECCFQILPQILLT